VIKVKLFWLHRSAASEKSCLTDEQLGTRVVSSEISGRKFPVIYSSLSGNFRKFGNYLCQSAVFKSSVAKKCCKMSMFLTNNSPDLYSLTLFMQYVLKTNVVLARLPGISADANKNYGRYNFQNFANISGNFRKY